MIAPSKKAKEQKVVIKSEDEASHCQTEEVQQDNQSSPMKGRMRAYTQLSSYMED